jgi:MoaA/NifB/PqqE/SkfB family radical SAM enzyme
MNTKTILYTASTFLKSKILKRKTPLAVGWAITDKCNLKCPYCSIWQRQSRDLPTHRVFEIIDSLAEMGTVRISFTGGEPLLRPDIGEIIDYAHDKGIETKLNSNGVLVKKKIGALKNLDMLNFSLEGPEEIHDIIRGKGSFKKVIEAVQTVKTHGIKFDFATVLTRINLDAVDFILDTARKENSKVTFQPATQLTLGGEEPNELSPPENEYREAVNKLIRKKKNGDSAVGNSVCGLNHLFKWPHPETMKCASGWVSCRIEPDGSVMYCSRESRLFSPKNCLDVGFGEAFDHLRPISCEDCWCAARVELNLAFSFKLSVMLNQIKSLIR